MVFGYSFDFFAVLIPFFCLKQVIFPKEKRPPSKDLTDGLKKLKESCKIKKNDRDL